MRLHSTRRLSRHPAGCWRSSGSRAGTVDSRRIYPVRLWLALVRRICGGRCPSQVEGMRVGARESQGRQPGILHRSARPRVERPQEAVMASKRTPAIRGMTGGCGGLRRRGHHAGGLFRSIHRPPRARPQMLARTIAEVGAPLPPQLLGADDHLRQVGQSGWHANSPARVLMTGRDGETFFIGDTRSAWSKTRFEAAGGRFRRFLRRKMTWKALPGFPRLIRGPQTRVQHRQVPGI